MEQKPAYQELEQRLEELEKEAADRSHALEDANTTLRVLLNRVGEERDRIEKETLFNLKKRIVPYIEKLKRSPLGVKELGYINFLEANLNDIIPPFSRKLISKHPNLTPKEIQVADLIRLGKVSKEIAELLNVSTGTVDFHRYRIRNKLGILNKKVNLKSYLTSLS